VKITFLSKDELKYKAECHLVGTWLMITDASDLVGIHQCGATAMYLYTFA
jgi:hypothetical protein